MGLVCLKVLFVCVSFFNGESRLDSIHSCHCAAFVYSPSRIELTWSFSINHCVHTNAQSG